jgi:thioredoxin reductase
MTSVCVVGAGSSGLAAVKNLREAGFEATAYERHQEVGGNWCFGGPGSRVYASTHTISSKPFTQYPDFPMPDDWPDYPHHSHLATYLQAYATHFELADHLRRGHEIVSAEPVGTPAESWEVTVRGPDGERTHTYDALVVANGHNWHPKIPDIPGLAEFRDAGGTALHSAEYKGPDPLRDRRVLVVGAGNTGCDIAVEATQHAASVAHSTRRGYWYAPKYTMGRPSDQVADALLGLRLPVRLRRVMAQTLLRSTVGTPDKVGLPKPDHALYETHPIVNSLLMYYVGQGDIRPVGDVERFDGRTAVFRDGGRFEADVVVLATGYLLRVPFLDPKHLDWDGDPEHAPRLYQHVFSPVHDTLFVVGLIQPDSGQFTLVHWQTQAVARYLAARGGAGAERFRRTVTAQAGQRWSNGVHYLDSTRHHFEVAHQHYLRGLQRTVRTLERAAGSGR